MSCRSEKNEKARQGLMACTGGEDCGKCPYDTLDFKTCRSDLLEDLKDYVEGLERDNEALLDDLKEADKIECEHCLHYEHAENNDCEASDFNCESCQVIGCACKNCRNCCNWEWRGASVGCGRV